MFTDTRRSEELRTRYLTEAIETASPATRLTMLYDALELDLARADKAFGEGKDLKEISDRLIHAQEIILTLRETLDVNAWEGAPRLMALYDYLNSELLQANMHKDRDRAAAAASHIGELAAAWRRAAAAGSAAGGGVAA